MFLDNLLPSYMGALAAPAALLKRLRYRKLVSFGLLANLMAMPRKSIIDKIDAIIDVGANQGQFAFMAHTVWPELPVYSFEPDPECFTRLSKCFEKFNISGQAFNLAMGATSGRMELQRYADNVNNSFLTRVQDEAVCEKVTVSCTMLDEVGLALPAFSAGLLKLDVQGFELFVLEGAKNFLKRCRYVLVEVAFSSAYAGGAHADEVMLALRNHGFECIQFLDVLRDDAGRFLEADMLYINRRWENVS